MVVRERGRERELHIQSVSHSLTNPFCHSPTHSLCVQCLDTQTPILRRQTSFSSRQPSHLLQEGQSPPHPLTPLHTHCAECNNQRLSYCILLLTTTRCQCSSTISLTYSMANRRWTLPSHPLPVSLSLSLSLSVISFLSLSLGGYKEPLFQTALHQVYICLQIFECFVVNYPPLE